MHSPNKYLWALALTIAVSMLFLPPNITLATAGWPKPSSQTTPPPTATPGLGENRNPRPDSQPPSSPSTPSYTVPRNNPTKPASALAVSSVTPERISATLNPGESHTATIQVSTGDVPTGKGDVMFIFDRTGSMDDEIGQAKSSAIQIMNDIRTQLPYAWFGVGGFMDYPGYYEYPGYADTYGSAIDGDVPWVLSINPTDHITDVSNAINDLWLGYGEDTPESYTRALYEAISVGWRPHAKKIIVLFGDAPTHDLDFAGYNFGGDPGRDAVAQTGDDLDYEDVVQQLADENISVIAIDSGGTPDSAATFKGMSVGYSWISGTVAMTVSGTNGHYFQLYDTSQIPATVVQLVGKETQQIDRLSLKVTEGYEDWVQITPAAYTNVPSNTTKTFDLTVTVPEGTLPGFYPFMIQALGDSAILGFTYVDVTVPAGDPINDLGFRPDPDGFPFKNESSHQTWAMFKQFFGAEQVEHSNGNRIHAADAFYQEYYADAGDGGSCDGFSATSLINYKNLSQPNAGDFAMPYHSPLYPQHKNDDIWEAIAYAQGIQLGLEANVYGQRMCDLLGNSPSDFYQLLKSHIQNDSPVVLGVRWKDIKRLGVTILPAGGHALVPYRFEEPSSDKAYVYVYDSNKPGDDGRRVEFDLVNDEWKYQLANLWIVPIITLEGDSSWCNLSVRPIEMYLHQGVAWWALAGWTLPSARAAETASPQAFATSGPARLLFTDDEGRRLGWDGEQFYDDIPSASYIPMEGGDAQQPKGLYYISADVLYDLEVHGYGEGLADVSLWSDGYMVALSDISVLTGTVASLDVAPDGSSIAVSGITSETQGSLSINHILSNEDHSTHIGNLAVSPGEEVRLQFNTAETTSSTVTLHTNSPLSRTYDLSLHRAGGDGYTSFGHANLVLDASSDSSVVISDWSSLDIVTVTVDLDQDGVVDESRSASNEAGVDAIALEASRPIVHPGGEQVHLIAAIRDQFGAYVADGTSVSFTTTLGELSIYEGETSGGLIDLTLTTDEQTGIATVTAQSGDIRGHLKIMVNVGYEIYLPLILRH